MKTIQFAAAAAIALATLATCQSVDKKGDAVLGTQHAESATSASVAASPKPTSTMAGDSKGSKSNKDHKDGKDSKDKLNTKSQPEMKGESWSKNKHAKDNRDGKAANESGASASLEANSASHQLAFPAALIGAAALLGVCF
ncbi:hypothetical protein GGI12_001800 [Dipsacomyces acuminosporus]|nr:hypothetical protein GGI12_001800 [Dipsacomyces acuminosporus]